MSKRKNPVITRPPVICPSCHGVLFCAWTPSGKTVKMLHCSTCSYTFDFAAYRAASDARLRAELTSPSPDAPYQCLIPNPP